MECIALLTNIKFRKLRDWRGPSGGKLKAELSQVCLAFITPMGYLTDVCKRLINGVWLNDFVQSERHLLGVFSSSSDWVDQDWDIWDRALRTLSLCCVGDWIAGWDIETGWQLELWTRKQVDRNRNIKIGSVRAFRHQSDQWQSAPLKNTCRQTDLTS